MKKIFVGQAVTGHDINILKEEMEKIYDVLKQRGYSIYSTLEEEGKNIFTVFFFGTFIPLQGVEYIIKAAKILEKESVHFLIVGDGQTKSEILQLEKQLSPRNVTFKDTLSQDLLNTEAAKVDACLGIFGDTPKTQRVIPNKVYECLAMKKSVITADTRAARELLSDKDVLFVRVADGASLAEGILRLKDDKKTMEKLAQNGYDTFVKDATPQMLGRELKNVIEEMLSV